MSADSPLLKRLSFLRTGAESPRTSLSDEIKEVLINLQGSIEHSSVNSARTAIRLKSVVHKTEETYSSVQLVGEASKKLFDQACQVAESADEALKVADEVRSLTHSGHRVSEQAVESGKLLQQHIHSTAARIDSLVQKVREVTQLSQVIREISTQTRILSFNAAIEAARAGKYGAGFSVVAEEVRNLADSTARQTNEIESLLRSIAEDLDPARAAIVESRNLADDAAGKFGEAGKIMREISSLSDGTSEYMSTIAKSVSEQKDSCESVFSAVKNAAPAVDAIRVETQKVAKDTADLASANEEVYVWAGKYNLGTIFHQALDDARELRDRAREIFEAAIARGECTAESYFDFRYIEIKGDRIASLKRLFDVSRVPPQGFSPPKFHTGYDEAIDVDLQKLEDEVLGRNPKYSFALAIDLNSYAPHHISACSKPWTGDPAKDLPGNRTKRIFNDAPVLIRAARIGLPQACQNLPSPSGFSEFARAGANLKESPESASEFLVQTYARDTGQVLTMLSVPLFIRGQRWGTANIAWQVD